MSTAVQIGTVTVQRIVEQEGPFFDALSFFPALTKEILDTEMTVVRNEFDRGENDPENVLEDRVLAHGFMAHPYHHFTIGWRADVENLLDFER